MTTLREAPTLEPPDPATRQPDPPPAVVVHVLRGEDGTVRVNPVGVGDVRVTEIQTLLGMAVAEWHAQLNLSNRAGP